MLFPFAAASVVVLVVGLDCRVWADASISTHFSLFQPSDLRGSCGRCFSLCNYRLPLVCLILIAPFTPATRPKIEQAMRWGNLLCRETAAGCLAYGGWWRGIGLRTKTTRSCADPLVIFP
uniref:Putative secreted protein n=1 Tax=Anopheles darlingi TaxID=43151 RepID=A0A2M4D4E6_ANODA